MAMGQGGTMTLSRLATARSIGVLRVSDYQRAKRFYEETLGLEVRDQSETSGSVMAGDGTFFDLYENPSARPPENTTLMFMIPSRDFEPTMQELRERGVEFEDYYIPEMDVLTVNGVATTADGQVAWFEDSEGNSLALTTA